MEKFTGLRGNIYTTQEVEAILQYTRESCIGRAKRLNSPNYGKLWTESHNSVKYSGQVGIEYTKYLHDHIQCKFLINEFVEIDAGYCIDAQNYIPCGSARGDSVGRVRWWCRRD